MTPREITLALRGTWRNSVGQTPCPVPGHGQGRGDLNPSLSIKTGKRQELLVHCHAGCPQGDVISALRERGLWPGAPSKPNFRYKAAKQPSQTDDRLWRTSWAESVPLTTTPAERYLVEVRRVVRTGAIGKISHNDLRFHPEAPFNSDGSWRVPGLMAAVRDRSGAIIGMQVTGLQANGGGKILARKQRHNFGRIRGGAVRLTPMLSCGSIAIAEGIETALGLTLLSDHPCWAALGAHISAFELPDDVDDLIIAADNDAPGLKAATILARRVDGACSVEIRHPAGPGADWADIAARQADHG